jgi:hypothetical protein
MRWRRIRRIAYNWASKRPENPGMKRKTRSDAPQVIGFLGIGLDADGQRRVTKAEHFLLVGGSAETHERMQETVVKFEEALDKTGKKLRDVTPHEAAELLRDAGQID